MPKIIRNQGAMAAVLCAGLLAACITSGVGDESAGLVARKDFNANQAWQPPQVMGRDFWNMLEFDSWGGANKCIKAFKDRPVYKESGLGYSAVPIHNKAGNTVTIDAQCEPDELTGGRTIRELYDLANNTNAPFFVIPFDTRKPWKNPPGEHNYDFAGYEQWKKDHPNFMGFNQGEWCNECILGGPWSAGWHETNSVYRKKLTKEQFAKIAREFPCPATREEALALVKKLFGILKTFHFNDPEKMTYLRACMNVDHYAYEWGGEIAFLETTDSGWGSCNYRWQPQFFFIRGASHQYGKKWGLYLASYYNGYPAGGGAMVGDAHVDYQREDRTINPRQWSGRDIGMSLSLYTRAMYLTYLSGPSFVMHERPAKFANKDMTDFSPWGKALEEWFDFTKNNKRGITYVPVALLVPFEQCYPAFGGRSWMRYDYERPDWMIDAFMFTIAPHNPVTKDGNEGALANSRYGDIYDAILPNTPGKPVALNVLNKYKVAIMLGRYAKDKALAGRLMEYVKDGGTLLINIKQLNEFFPESFTGIERTGATQPVQGDALALIDHAKIALPGAYEYEKIKLKGAQPVLVDAATNTLASVNNYGKGRVIVACVDYLIPKNDMAAQGDVLADMVLDKEFPLPAYFLGQIVKEVLPLEVKGDIEYGLNKLADGWLLYLINNKGVTKYVDTAPSFDPTKTAKVEVFLKNMQSSDITELRAQKAIARNEKNNSFTIEVSPGDVKVVKIMN